MLMWSLLAVLLTSNPVELGSIEWRRGFEAALMEAHEKEKPLLVLFQEVPG
jgi:hypothetical protein